MIAGAIISTNARRSLWQSPEEWPRRPPEWERKCRADAERSFTEANKGFQALAAKMMEYSKSAFDDAIRTWEQLIGVRSREQAIQIQSDYAKRVYENHMAELKKLVEMTVGMVRAASKPVEDASRKFR
jgi:hypothetical protein